MSPNGAKTGLVAEVHPFVDGNGRLARIFLNSELFARDQQRIIVPTSRRGEYLDALRVMPRRRRPEFLARVMGGCQEYVAAIDWSSFDAARKRLEADGAFEESFGGGLDLEALFAVARRPVAPSSRS
jgi:fido (protein-threonine AMPylation protein)